MFTVNLTLLFLPNKAKSSLKSAVLSQGGLSADTHRALNRSNGT